MGRCFFFKKKTAYEMRISDWSSYVGSSDVSWATFDVDCRCGGYLGTVDPGLPDELRAAANRDVTERTLAGYVMAEYDADLGAMPVRGNFGDRKSTRLNSSH